MNSSGAVPPLTTADVEEQESEYLAQCRDASFDSSVTRFSLAFSGGGIRSAAICLGIARALACRDLLGNIDYLSTVSGGGYTGCLLSSLIRQRGLRSASNTLKDDGGFTDPQSPLYHLRRYSNYLTPRVGLFSIDSLAGGVLCLRNLAVNWLVFLPFYFAAIAATVFLSIWSSQQHWSVQPATDHQQALTIWGYLILFLTIALICWSAVEMLRLRPDWVLDQTREQSPVLVVHGVGFFLSGLLLAVLISGIARIETTLRDLLIYASFFVCLVAAHAILLLERGERPSAYKLPTSKLDWLASVLPWIASALVAVTLMYFLARWLVDGNGAQCRLIWCYALLLAIVPLVLALLNLVSDVIYVLLTNSLSNRDMEHEWLAYANAGQMRLPIIWFLFSSAVTVGIYLVEENVQFTSGSSLLFAGTPTVSGLLTLWLGRAKATVATVRTAKESWKEYYARLALNVLIPIFLFFCTAVCTYSLLNLVNVLFGAPGERVLLESGLQLKLVHAFSGAPDPFVERSAVLTAMAVLLLTGVTTSALVDLNEFSLHGIYKNRLVRTFLGASKVTARRPNFLTGFDDHDDFALAKLSESQTARRPNFLTGFDSNDNVIRTTLSERKDAGEPGRPLPYLHVINMAMNVLRTRDLAIQERRALPFFATQLHIGSRRLRPVDDDGKHRAPGCFRHTHSYLGLDRRQVTCGNAMAISGAAVNSNMGYHSSPFLSLLLTIFNVRLGAWLSNPRTAVPHAGGLWRELKSRVGSSPIGSMVREALGMTNEDMPFVQLSDGGHFENLGLYELLARGQRVVIAVDAGADPNSDFSDLGIAARLVRLDLQAKIVFRPSDLKSLSISPEGTQAATHVVADLEYADGTSGVLLYLKSGVVGDEPLSIQSYLRTNRRFPHEPTTDQWMGEAQFNAYMLLGEHMMQKALPALENLPSRMD